MSSLDIASSSENESVASDTSTLIYDHECFESFKKQVLTLASTILGCEKGSIITIERMRGGGYNRVLGISILGNDNTLKQYVCRIPRFDFAQIRRDLAPLQLLRQQSIIQVPDVVAYDLTGENAIRDPYMIQKRVPGVSLFPVYPSLPHATKCTIAKELGEFFSQMHLIGSNVAGKLILTDEILMIQPFVESSTAYDIPYSDSTLLQHPSETLIGTLKARQALDLDEDPGSVAEPLFDDMINMVQEMRDLDLLDDDRVCLCHLDLAPRNILVNDPPENARRAISAILDWDSAVFAPRFMSCAPPMWLWAWSDDGDEDEKLSNNLPATSEMQEIKTLFEQYAGPIYKRFAYPAEYRLARGLTQLAIDGLRYNEDYYRAESLVAEWKALAPQLKSSKENLELMADLPIHFT